MVEMPISSLRGKWAQGIEPRDFTWIIKGQMAVCEQLGGRGESHRVVRRQEEIVWALNKRFHLTISLLPNEDNLASYSKYLLDYRHWPMSDSPDPVTELVPMYEQIVNALDHKMTLLFHRYLVGDLMMGYFGGFLIWARYIDDPTQALILMQRIFGATAGEQARSIIADIHALDSRSETLPTVWNK